jgi:hypothetical protein
MWCLIKTLALIFGKRTPKVNKPRSGPFIIPDKLTLKGKVCPKCSINSTKLVQRTPSMTTISFKIKTADFSVNCLLENRLIKSL